MIIVSLTSTNSRLTLCRQTLVSLSNQSLNPDKIVVWLSEEPYLRDPGVPRDAEWIKEIQEALPAVEVRWTKNTGPYRKLIPSLQAFRDDDIIVTADDDIIYGFLWLQILVDAHNAHPDEIIAARVRKVTRNKLKIPTTYVQWPVIRTSAYLEQDFVITHGGGAVFKRTFFSEADIADTTYVRIAPTSDDLWFSRLVEISGRGVRCAPKALTELFFLEHTDGLIRHNSPLLSGLKDKFLFWLLYKRLGNLGFSICGNDVAYKGIRHYFNKVTRYSHILEKEKI